ncbi:MAG: HlyD family efflux transporter periplasmic adaptor subunit [Phycisphaerae bacterium]|nr:HlyD family efflux transporter periplasmic adaptor subunit [Phycisphaerae bacterium]
MNHHKGKLHISFLPIVVWITALGAVVLLYSHQAASFQQVGMAQGEKCVIKAVDTGVLINTHNSQQLAIKEYQYVQKDQVLAYLNVQNNVDQRYDMAMLELKKNTATAELEKIRADLIATEQKLNLENQKHKQDLQYRYWQLLLETEKARIDVIEIQTELEPDKILLKDLQLEKDTLAELFAQKAIEEYEVQKAQVQYETLAKKIEGNEKMLFAAQKQLETLKQRANSFNSSFTEFSTELLEPLKKAIDLQQKKIAELLLPETVIAIVAPFDGIISKIYHRPDNAQTVAKNDAIFEITATTPDQVKLWLNQGQLGIVKKDMLVEVIKTTEPRIIFASRIESLSPAIELLPEHMWDSPTMPKWGWPAIIPVNGDIMGLTPDEVVGIRGIK